MEVDVLLSSCKKQKAETRGQGQPLQDGQRPDAEDL